MNDADTYRVEKLVALKLRPKSRKSLRVQIDVESGATRSLTGQSSLLTRPWKTGPHLEAEKKRRTIHYWSLEALVPSRCSLQINIKRHGFEQV